MKQSIEAKNIIRDAVKLYRSSELDGKIRIRTNAEMVLSHGVSSAKIIMGITDERMQAVAVFLRIIKNK